MTKKFIEIKIEGVDEAIKDLKGLENKTKKIKECLSFNELFNGRFMKKYTKYDDFGDFVAGSKLILEDTTVITEEIFKAIPDKEFDEYISKTTDFKSWAHMREVAVKVYLGL